VTALQRILCGVTVASLLAFIPAGQQAMAGRLMVQEFTLGNGLKVLLVEEHKAPVITVQIWYKVGSRNEVMGRAGLSHMLEHMMFKGTPSTGRANSPRSSKRTGAMTTHLPARTTRPISKTWPRTSWSSLSKWRRIG